MYEKYPKPKYPLCWWCNGQFLAKRAHVCMRPTSIANANEHVVSVHLMCADNMKKEGGWENARWEDMMREKTGDAA